MTEPSHSHPPPVPVCGIGASAGGLEALQGFFGALPADLGLAYVVIVHLAPDHKSELPSILRRWTRMPVVEVGHHDTVPLQRNHVYVIAPDRTLEITDSAVGASAFAQPRGKRAAIDLFFRSLAEGHGDGFAVLLSGSGSDGALGAKAVKERGGLILVQDPAEAGHSGMPRAAIATGVADVVLPVRDLAARLAELARTERPPMPLTDVDGAAESTGEDDERAVKEVLALLHKRSSHDFSRYKRGTILRRLARRMQLADQPTVRGYLAYLRSNATEVSSLFNDFLISVTTFFRDADAWAALHAQVIAPAVEAADAETQLRAWVPGCATGEEAFTVAILLHEEFERQKRPPNFIVLASDIDESALSVAREGVYASAIGADVSESRLQRYFRADDDHHRILAELRDHVVFATHNVLRDPPFSRLHLISCRNLLIYLDRDLQAHVMSIFRYAARDDGMLFLGASESVNEDLFYPLDKKFRIFGMRPREDATRPLLPDFAIAPFARVRHSAELRPPSRTSAAESHVVALEQLAPPSVLVDERWNVIHVSATASRFFQQSGGTLARRLTDLVRPELRDDLHATLQQAVDGQGSHVSPFVAVRFNGAAHCVAVLVQQRPPSAEGRGDVLVTFLDGGVVSAAPAQTEPATSHETVHALGQKLRQSEDRIDAIRYEHHLVTEDLRAANEELQSLNEEYRSTTEELETSKEELQSINEELHTVNHELKLRLEEVSRGHSDLENLMAATNVATLFLTPDLRIKRFTPQLAEIFKVRLRDLDRPINDLKHSLDYDLEEDARRVLATAIPIEREVRGGAGQVFAARVGPYWTAGRREIDGVVATFFDVTALKRAEESLRASQAQLATELNVMRRLHAMTMSVAAAPTVREALDRVLAAAVDLHGADFGHMQLLDPESGRLTVETSLGFAADAIARFAEVGAVTGDTASSRAVRTRSIVQIPDVATDPAYATRRRGDTEQAGYRGVQSIPLKARAGNILGTLSVHYRQPHEFTERDTQLGDLFARQTSELIESRLQVEHVRQLNEALRQRTAELEASQHQLATQAANLEEQDRHREEFLASLGHELRNPMAAILGSLELLGVTEERSARAVDVLKRQTRHMTRLINDLLDVTRVRHGRLRLERKAVALGDAVQSAIDTIRTSANRKGLALRYTAPSERLVIDADAERLAQVLDNLLRNAVTYTSRGEIEVIVEREGAFARISVRDTGDGIAANEIAGLFEAYRRGDGRRGDGLGLGLALVKALVEAHGGTVRSESEGPGRGSIFSFTLPLSAAEPAAAGSAAIPPLPKRRVLVVDDQRDIADVTASLLESLGQDVVVAYDARSALELARQHRPDIAFVDVTMPEGSGSGLARRLREEFDRAALRLVAVTGHDAQDRRVREGEFDAHVLKPATVENLVEALNGGEGHASSSG